MVIFVQASGVVCGLLFGTDQQSGCELLLYASKWSSL